MFVGGLTMAVLGHIFSENHGISFSFLFSFIHTAVMFIIYYCKKSKYCEIAGFSEVIIHLINNFQFQCIMLILMIILHIFLFISFFIS